MSDSGQNNSGLFSGHQPATNDFKVSTNFQDYHKSGDVLRVTLTHPVNQNITGTPRIPIQIGSANVYANYVSGSGSKNLIFEYTILPGQNDSDGIQLSTILNLNGGSATFETLSGTVNSNTTLPSVDTSDVFVDTDAPTVSLIVPPLDGTYTRNKTLQYLITFNEPVSVQGSPTLSLNIGGTLQSASYVSGSLTDTLLFQKSIAITDVDPNGVETISPLVLNGGQIKDLAGNIASISFDITGSTPPASNVIVDGAATIITGVTKPLDNTYITGGEIDIVVEFSDIVTVTGLPLITVQLDTGPVEFTYQSGTGTDELTFRYTILSSDNDNDGIEIKNPIDLNSGTINDQTTKAAILDFIEPSTPQVLVNPTNATLTLDSFTPINIANNNAYTLSGTCSEDGVGVEIDLGGITDVTPCASGLYSFTIDASTLLDDPAISITVDHSNAAKIIDSVLKDTVTPALLTLDPLDDIYMTNASSYSFTGTCSEEGLAVRFSAGSASAIATCTSGAFSFASVDVSGEADSPNFTISVSHNDEAGNPLSTSANVLKDTEEPDVLITYAKDINSSNVNSYELIGTCSENGESVDIEIGSITTSAACSSSVWSVPSIDVSALPEGSTTINATHTKTNGNFYTDSQVITKSALTPIVTINTPSDIDNSNETSFTVTGSCSDNGQVVSLDIGGISKTANCANGNWSSGIMDVSALLDGAISITADHLTAAQASIAINKDSAADTVTITSAVNISSTNEASYLVSGSCSSNGASVNIAIAGINITQTCSNNSWSTGITDVSSLTDGPIIINADHAAATTATKTVNKDTSNPTVESLAITSQLTEEIELSWNLNDPGGFTIDDFIINYRIKDTPTWLNFDDGPSTTPSAIVTGLKASTTYEFRVNVSYDTSFNSEWSNIAEGLTQPDSPIFGPNAAMNVGGATTHSVAAYEDGTNITLNGSALVTLNQGQTHVFSANQFDVIDADKPIYAAGRRGSGADDTKANMVWVPTLWASKSFSFSSTRNNPQTLRVFAIEDSVIEVKQGSSTLDSATVSAGSGATLSWSIYGSYQVVSSGAILAFHASDSTIDPKPLLPSSTEIIGFPSSSMTLNSFLDSTNYLARHSNSSQTSGALNKSSAIVINPQGISSEYQSESLLLSADKKISGASYADSAGICSAPFLPTNLMKKKYIINVSASYVAFASKSAGTIDIMNAAGATVGSLTLTRSGADSNAPYKARTTTANAGYRYISNVPMAGWYQPNTDTGASANDETILYGTD